MATYWRDLLAIQDGVLARAQALTAGLTGATWDWRLTRGTWQSPLRGIAVSHTGPLTDRQQLWVAALYAGEGAALCGEAALAACGQAPRSWRAIDVAIPHRRQVSNTRIANGRPVVVRRIRSLDGLRAGIATSPPRVATPVAVLQAAAWASSGRAAESKLAGAVQRRTTTVPLLRTALELLPGLPRRALLRVALDDIEQGAHALSELDFLRFLRRNCLPLPDALQVRLRAGGNRYLDARYERQGITIEVDGAHHRDVDQWQADALRTLEISVALPGERIIRLTPGMLRHDGNRVATLLRSLLR